MEILELFALGISLAIVGGAVIAYACIRIFDLSPGVTFFFVLIYGGLLASIMF